MLTKGNCPKNMLSIKDALEALEGKWKLLILFSLSAGPKRFKEIARDVQGVTDKTLSKELKQLEANKLVQRSVYDTHFRQRLNILLHRMAFLWRKYWKSCICGAYYTGRR